MSFSFSVSSLYFFIFFVGLCLTLDYAGNVPTMISWSSTIHNISFLLAVQLIFGILTMTRKPHGKTDFENFFQKIE